MTPSKRERRPRLRAGLVALTGCLLLASATAVAAREEAQGRVSGRIVDEDTARPLSLAQIYDPVSEHRHP
ncbi:hypothetical protein [Candidatus Palauibacter sp.]|uniref:hypothetical protein n=1 Tax=Candidatus Palauibacter sp. TaxID=3101350 RepID=UPI003B5944F7